MVGVIRGWVGQFGEFGQVVGVVGVVGLSGCRVSQSIKIYFVSIGA